MVYEVKAGALTRVHGVPTLSEIGSAIAHSRIEADVLMTAASRALTVPDGLLFVGARREDGAWAGQYVFNQGVLVWADGETVSRARRAS